MASSGHVLSEVTAAKSLCALDHRKTRVLHVLAVALCHNNIIMIYILVIHMLRKKWQSAHELMI